MARRRCRSTAPLRHAQRARWAGHRLGVRPEDLAVGTGRLDAEVVTVEPLGAETILAVRLRGIEKELMVRANRDSTAAVGDRLSIDFDRTAALLFDKETGHAVR